MSTNNQEVLHPGISLLVVDDATTNLRVIGDILKPYYRVLATTSGERALSIAKNAPHPDLILLDIMMPGMDGYEVLRRLRSQPETASIPVIFVTAMSEDGDEARGLELGAVDYISKPVVPELLLARVKTQLELKSARDWLLDRNTVLAEEVARQVAELKRAKELAEAASHAKTVFINTMSNELYNPMNGVMGMLQMITTEASGSESSIREYANIALSSARDMTQILASILEYSEIAQGSVELSPSVINLQSFLQDVAKEWSQRANAKGRLVQHASEASRPLEILVDEAKLTRVMDMLLENAIAFTGEGKIDIVLSANSSQACITIIDTGLALSEWEISQMFAPFAQFDGSAKRQSAGIGLGLAIAYRLVELMGGTLSARNEGVSGCAFILEFPIAGLAKLS